MAAKASRRRRRMTPEDRRAQIIAAARSVFLDYGFAGTRVRDIAERSGITENLVYVRFANKNEIYQAAVTDPLDDLVDQLASAVTEMTQAGESRLKLLNVSTRCCIRAWWRWRRCWRPHCSRSLKRVAPTSPTLCYPSSPKRSAASSPTSPGSRLIHWNSMSSSRVSSDCTSGCRSTQSSPSNRCLSKWWPAR